MEYRRASSLVTKAEMQLTPFGHRLIAHVCECSAPEQISDDQAVEKIKTIYISFGRSVNDDDVFLYTKSPFDNKWYYFAAGFGSGYSETVYSINLDLADPNNGFVEPVDRFSHSVHLDYQHRK